MIQYQIKFYSYWHAGSGLSDGIYADMLVNKTEAGHPYIPGKTLKGLIKDAAISLSELPSKLVSDQFINEVFGRGPASEDEDDRELCQEGKAFFTNAHLSNVFLSHLSSDLRPHLYQTLASTRIDNFGIARDQSLRKMEVTIPLTLYGEIRFFPQKENYTQQLEYCLQWVKRMGLSRSKGLGRCQFSIIKTETT